MKKQFNLVLVVCFYSYFFCHVSVAKTATSSPRCKEMVGISIEANGALKENQPVKARNLLLQFIESHPKCSEYSIYQLLGNAWALDQHWKEAEKAYRHAWKLHPNNYATALNLAQACFRLAKYQEAAQLFFKAYKIGGAKNLELIYKAAVSDYRAGNFEKAEKRLAAIATDAQTNPSTWWELRVRALEKMGKDEKARVLQQELLQFHPLRLQDWKTLARLSLKLKNDRDAAMALEIACQIGSPSKADWMNLAAIYQRLKMPLLVADSLTQAYGTSPSPDECDKLATWYARAGDYDRAHHFYDLAIAQAPTAERYLEKGKLFCRQGQWKEALETLQHCVNFPGENALVEWLIGVSAWELGDMGKAKAVLEKVSVLPEYHQQATALLRMLNADSGNPEASTNQAQIKICN